MTKAELISEISNQTGINKLEVTCIIDVFTKSICQNMANDKSIYIRGFGTFTNVKRKEKKARNINENTTIVVPAHFIPTFTFCKEVKTHIKNCVKIE